MSSALDSESDCTTHHLYHDWAGDESVGDQVIEAVAKYESTSRDDLPLLKKFVNPTALDTIFDSSDEEACSAGCITFSYYGYTILIQSTGQILIKKT
ncbi:hypothetical protein SAMN04487948_11511 [Halogranum amylolyticum]|uniref:Halobacterial output domain-containing protein n=1 Tax=Halogranum amylolyticum TaxID=660520 RepID=A0A1H8V9R7_9EURY|nr:HalOD1 output domain-containing protein [Halogranum amylolyticum]SEP12043.1 hypothetical protein SAMN04487948_11511 [Halogranum amylolyticum]